MLSYGIAAMVLISMFSAKGNEVFYAETFIVTEVKETVAVFRCYGDYNLCFTQLSEDWFEGDLASCIMTNNGTPYWVYDDVPLTCKASGWIEFDALTCQ